MLISSFEGLIKDKAIIASEVMSEYNTKVKCKRSFINTSLTQNCTCSLLILVSSLFERTKLSWRIRRSLLSFGMNTRIDNTLTLSFLNFSLSFTDLHSPLLFSFFSFVFLTILHEHDSDPYPCITHHISCNLSCCIYFLSFWNFKQEGNNCCYSLRSIAPALNNY